MRQKQTYLLGSVLLICFDQLTKAAVSHFIPLYSSVGIIPGFFDLTHIRNRGAIFGIFSQSKSTGVFIILTLASVVALIFIIYYFLRSSPEDRLMKTALMLILSGALGNIIDRIFRGYVVDFLDFHIRGAHWPSFNVADSCISIGALLMVIVIFMRRS